jgi:hypothetical protein
MASPATRRRRLSGDRMRSGIATLFAESAEWGLVGDERESESQRRCRKQRTRCDSPRGDQAHSAAKSGWGPPHQIRVQHYVAERSQAIRLRPLLTGTSRTVLSAIGRPKRGVIPSGQCASAHSARRPIDRACPQSRRRSRSTECAPVAEQTAPETARFDLQQANRPVEVQGVRSQGVRKREQTC